MPRRIASTRVVKPDHSSQDAGLIGGLIACGVVLGGCEQAGELDAKRACKA